jgi:TPR repeat protein
MLFKIAKKPEVAMSWRPLVPWVSVVGLWLVGCNYETGQIAFDRGNHQRAIEVWENAASWGDVQAQMALADLYSRGEHVPQDLDRALYHAESAAQSTPSGARQWAEHTLATVYARQGRYADAITWYRSDPKQAARWLNAAAAQGNDEAKRMLSEQQTSAKAAIPEGLPPVDGSCTAVDEAELQRTENDPDIQA